MNNLSITHHTDHLMVSNHYFSGVSESQILDAYREADQLFELNGNPKMINGKNYNFTEKELIKIKEKIILGEMYIQCVNKKDKSSFQFNFDKYTFVKTSQMKLQVNWRATEKFKKHDIAMLMTKHTLNLSQNDLEGFQAYLDFLNTR